MPVRAPFLPLVLLGAPGAGKSTVGRALARALGAPFVDVDEEIARDAGATVRAIFEAEGEGGFRVAEHRALTRAIELGGPLVIALGAGGHVARESARWLRHRALSIVLDVPHDRLLARLSSSSERPLLDGDPAARLAALERGRAAARRALAHHVVDGAPPVDDVVRAIQGLLSAPTARAFSLPAPADLSAGDVVFDDAAHGIPALIDTGRVAREWPRVAIVDERVRALFDDRGVDDVIVVDAARAKRAETALDLASRVSSRAGPCTLVGVGGGSVLDLCGFVAHVVRRGLPHVLVPTTLLAMVDAAHGGKTALDTEHARNAIGAFHMPVGVVIDVRFLDHEPVAGRRSGAVEAFKHELLRPDAPASGAAVVDDALRALAEEGLRDDVARADVRDVVERAVSLKRAVVDVDPMDRGPRFALNLGHTIGHALERASGFALSHGEAVRRGLVGALALSVEHAGLSSTVRDALVARARAFAPPPTETKARPALDDVLRALPLDKKSTHEGPRFVLLAAPGRVVVEHVREESVREAARLALDA